MRQFSGVQEVEPLTSDAYSGEVEAALSQDPIGAPDPPATVEDVRAPIAAPDPPAPLEDVHAPVAAPIEAPIAAPNPPEDVPDPPANLEETLAAPMAPAPKAAPWRSNR